MSRCVFATRLAASLLALSLYAAGGLAQPPRPLDPLAEAQARIKIADDKASADVREAIRSAEQTARTNPTKAIQNLKAARTNIIDSSATISEDARKNLTATITSKIAQLDGRPLPAAGSARTDTGYKPDPAGASVKRDKQSTYESYAAEVKAVNEGIKRIESFQKAGLPRDAEREIADLARKYPNNPTVLRLQEKDSLNTRVDDAKVHSSVQEKRMALALKGVDSSSIASGGDVEFPDKKEWARITEARSTKPKLSEKERKLIEALNRPMSVDWNGKMMEEALQELSNAIDQNLFVDKKSLTDQGTDLSKPVTLQAKGVSARTILRQVLAAQGLTFLVKDEVIQVVTVEKARDMLVTQVYYLGDLVRGVGPFGGPLAGPNANLQQSLANVDTIIKAIKASVDPLCWKENGGPCTITFHYPSMAIIVKASSEVHSSLGSALGGK